MLELKQLTDKTLEIFNCQRVDDLGDALMAHMEDECAMQAFSDLVGGDLSKDWMQMIFQYYKADRKEKKQDYTPACIGKFMSKLIGESSETYDMCAGSGSLTIQRLNDNPDGKIICYEIDKNVIPFLLFNLAIRNKTAEVHRADVLQDEVYESWQIKKGEQYGKVSCIKPAL